MYLFLDYDGPLHPDLVYRQKGKIVPTGTFFERL